MDKTEATIAEIAFIIFALSIAVEWWIWRKRGVRKFDWRDSLANYSLVFMQIGLDLIARALYVFLLLGWCYDHGLQLVPDAWWANVLGFLGVDLAYYWYHRASHRVRFLWAIHVSHHSSEFMNFSTALRQPPLEHLIDWIWFIPLAWLGFHPKLLLFMYGLNLTYQFFIHTELINKFPRWVEWIFNTPSHHRVHHGTNTEYLDVNYGGVLIIWDRLFHSFVPEKAPVHYGILHPIKSYNPIYIAFHLWAEIWRDLRKPASLMVKLRYIFAPPGWAQEYQAQKANQ